jgi:hypothetical protein
LNKDLDSKKRQEEREKDGDTKRARARERRGRVKERERGRRGGERVQICMPRTDDLFTHESVYTHIDALSSSSSFA